MGVTQHRSYNDTVVVVSIMLLMNVVVIYLPLVHSYRLPEVARTFFAPFSKHEKYYYHSNNNMRQQQQLSTRIRLNANRNEFDYVLGEYDTSNTDSVAALSQIQKQQQQQNRRIVLPSTTTAFDSSDRKIVLASSTFAGTATTATTLYDDEIEQEETITSEETSEGTALETTTGTDDPYAAVFDTQMNKINQYQEKASSNALENKLKSMDLQDIVLTLFIPGLLTFVAGRFIFQKASAKVSANTDAILDNFANEMIYHDGDYTEMELCYKDYSKKLLYLGPIKSDSMIKRYLELYSKKKTASPQAIVSLSYVFTIFQLSEEKAASILVSLCNEMGTSKISSIGKLLFLGTRILKSDAAKQKLQNIKALIMSTYRDERVAETLVETSQQAIAEAAYRTAVLGAGKNQKDLAPGWEVLGLSYEAATQIWENEKKENFMSDRETMYGGQTRKYDKHGRQIKEDGKLANPDEARPEDTDPDSGGGGGGVVTSNVYECGNCGHTLFVAAGRESKFFGESFKCPECGAAKSEFKARNIEE